MKASFKFIIAALAVTAALAACTKETTPPNFENDKVAPASEGSRVIAVSFAPQTKTTLDGFQPKFVNRKDTILLVSYPEGLDPVTETRVVSVDDKDIATISTNLTGDLVALYPAKYAKEIEKTFGLPVPAVQSGKFADANICGAKIKDGAKSATFTNSTSLFIINPPDGAKNLTVKSLKQIETSSGQRTGYRNEINLSENEEERYSISIPNGPDEDGKYYVALYYGFNLSDLSFEAWFDNDGTTGSVKGIPTSKIAQQATALGKEYGAYNQVQYGIAYTIDKNNWHDYVTIGGRKWATMNVGATSETSPDSYGTYFAWGDVVGQVPSSSTFSTLFDWAHTPFNNSQSDYDETYFASVKGTECPNGILALKNDAAFANWGGAWRMPTGGDAGEFQALYDATNSVWSEGSGINGYRFTDKSNTSNVLFFPAAGWGHNTNTNLSKAGSFGYYWSSSLGSSSQGRGYELDFNSTSVSPPGQSLRYLGYSVRAIIDDAASAPAPTPDNPPVVNLPDGALSGVFTVNAKGKKVHFSKGNLYFDGKIWGFEEEQYYFRTFMGNGKCDKTGYNKTTGTPYDHWGLFGWSASSKNFGKSISQSINDYPGTFLDWGNAIDNKGTWTTLSGGPNGEWQYLFENHVYVWGICKNVPGRFIAPDGFEGGQSALSDAVRNWEIAQADGIVFLPAAGNRVSSKVSEVGDSGFYWSSSPCNGNFVFDVKFNSSNSLYPDNSGQRFLGCSVRLVTESK